MEKNYLFEKYEFKKMPNFIESRDVRSTATELQDGRILFIGGINQKELSSSEIYNPNYNNFKKTANLNIARARHSAILLKNGNVLVTGGNTEIDGKYKVLKSAEIYDVNNNKFIQISDMNYEMLYHKMYLLADGNIIVIFNPSKIEIFDSKKLNFKKIKGLYLENDNDIYNFLQLSENKILMYPRTYIPQRTPVAILNLPDLLLTDLKITLFEKVTSFYNVAKISENKILVTGGDDSQLDSKIIDLTKMKIIQTIDLTQNRYNHISIKLDSNNILLLGGEAGVAYTLESLKTTDLYNIKENKFLQFKNMNYKRGLLDFIQLSNGNYIIYGGLSMFGNEQPPEILIVK